MVYVLVYRSFDYHRFGYRGQKTELILNMAKWLFLTLITFGIYGAWMEMNMRKYVLENVRMGNARFLYKGEGLDYFFAQYYRILSFYYHTGHLHSLVVE
jgi:uncharacterized membrane protein YjgN (DUF898 family)